MSETQDFSPVLLYPGFISFHLDNEVFHFYLIHLPFYPGLFHFNFRLLHFYDEVFDPGIGMYIIHYDIVSLLRVNK